MKIAILALSVLVAAAAPLALAQEVESSPAPSASPEATASEKTDSSPSDPSVSVTTEKSASPSPTAASSPAATKSSSPAAKSSPSASPSKNASPAAVMPTKKSSAEATIREIEDKWEASVKTHDPSVAQAYLGDDFRGVSSKGKVMNKSNLIAEIKKDTDTYTSTKNNKVEVRVFGGQFAVATGISTEAGKAKDGKEFKRSFRWTDVWVQRSGKWQCVASQAMLMPR